MALGTKDDGPKEPFNIDVEQALLGALMVDASLFDRVSDNLKPDIFYDPLHQRMCHVMLAMWGRNESVTPLTVQNKLDGDEGLKEVGPQYIINLAIASPALPNVTDYVAILRDLMQRRGLMQIGQGLIDEATKGAYDAHNPAGEIARLAADALCDIALDADKKKPRQAAEVAMSSLKRIERALAGHEPIPSVPSGLSKLDEITGGFRENDLILVAGRPGMGKSALMCGIALRAALAGHPVLVYSLEMGGEQWTDRNICDLDFDTLTDPNGNYGKKPLWYQNFRKAKLSEDELERACMAQFRLTNLDYLILDDDRLTIEDIGGRSRAFASAHRGKLGLIVIDYTQIVDPSPQHGRNREQEVAHIVRGAKSLGKRLRWPVISGAQIGREGDNGPPTLKDLRESGQLEQEADIVIAPYRPVVAVRAREPTGNAPEAEKEAWDAEIKATQHIMDLRMLKFRQGGAESSSLWCDMGASAIRDEMPSPAQKADDGQGLLV